ncbi:hypothetical protein BDQ17DRAFT_1435360 [Cyathus striatus]|nr:hypothetical protein BDQ17DRAFT_1435360 [Cyathus striatus]
MSSPGTVKKSEIFNKPGADATFKSSDGVLFALHKKNLETHAKGFPPADINVGAEIIDLSEESETLNLLFQFVYPDDDIPDLSDVSFTFLMKLACASEKYVMHSAIPLCKMRMLFFVRSYYSSGTSENNISKRENLKLIVGHALEHSGYTKILDEAVPLLAVSEPLETTLLLFPAMRQLSWALYREQWAVVQRYASPYLSEHKASCSKCKSSSDDFGMIYFNDFKLRLLNNTSCSGLDYHWKMKVSKSIEAIRKLSSFFEQSIQQPFEDSIHVIFNPPLIVRY